MSDTAAIVDTQEVKPVDPAPESAPVPETPAEPSAAPEQTAVVTVRVLCSRQHAFTPPLSLGGTQGRRSQACCTSSLPSL